MGGERNYHQIPHPPPSFHHLVPFILNGRGADVRSKRAIKRKDKHVLLQMSRRRYFHGWFGVAVTISEGILWKKKTVVGDMIE